MLYHCVNSFIGRIKEIKKHMTSVSIIKF